MSKVVKGIGRAVGKVVKGAAKVVKQVVKSPLGKIALLAAATYFGVPAIAGAFGGGATGTIMGNLGAAWSSLGSAATSAMAGNFGQAASQLGTGMLGSAAPAATGAGLAPAAATALPVAAPAASGMLSSPYLAPALVHAGGSMISGIGAAKGQQAMMRREDEKEEEALARYNKNVGTRLWSK